MVTDQDRQFMQAALEEARKAQALGEVPIGAVIVREGRIIAAGHNLRETLRDALCHAEIVAIHHACRILGGWRLEGCTLYVTLEPCPMCSGAIINARIGRVVYGARDEKAGCCGSVANLFAMPFNHHPVIEGGVLEEECAGLLQEFFRSLRQKKTEEKAARKRALAEMKT